jgi:hypothetical protein
MLAVQGIYDGNNFIALEKFPAQKKYKVIITFIEEVDEAEEVRNFTAQTNALDFWKDDAENIYQDYLKK